MIVLENILIVLQFIYTIEYIIYILKFNWKNYTIVFNFLYK